MFISVHLVSVRILHGQNSIKAPHQTGIFTSIFTENKGQVHDYNSKPRPDILFSGATKEMTFFMRQTGIVYQLSKVKTWKRSGKHHLPGKEKEKPIPDKIGVYRVDVKWLNCNEQSEIVKGNALGGYNNYCSNTCPDGITGVRSFDAITYKNIYNGIDLVWYKKDNALKYDYIIAAGANYKEIRSEITGTSQISLNEKGELLVKTPLGDIIEQAPLVIQDGKMLKANWVIEGNVVSFNIEDVNHQLPFVIDPGVRIWGTYYGGGGPFDENGSGCCTDKSGNVYFSGTSGNYNTNIIATPGAFEVNAAGQCAFLAKFNASGQRQWGTYYADGQFLLAAGLACSTDPSGNVYLTGYTEATAGVATTGAHQTSLSGEEDAFLVKFNSNGARLWGTYYGGSSHEFGFSCATDGDGNVYLAGTTSSTNGISSPNGHQQNLAFTFGNGFLVKFNASGERQWGTYYGGSVGEGAWGCATDLTGNVYITGYTASNTSSNIVTPGCHQSTFSGNQSAFLVKFNSSGQRQWGTYYGDNNFSYGYACITDADGNVYITGSTTSLLANSIATPGSHQPILGPGNMGDGFLAKFNTNGIRLWGTYYGGTKSDVSRSCATDINRNIYLCGYTESVNGTAIATPGTQQPVANVNGEAFLAAFGPDGQRHWGTYYGSPGQEAAYSCALDLQGNIYLCGMTGFDSGNLLATPGSHQPNPGGREDAFFAKFDNCIIPSPDNTSPNLSLLNSSDTLCSGLPVTLNVSGASSYVWIPGSVVSSSLTIVPSSNINFTVEGTDSQGCRKNLEIYIPVAPTPTMSVTPFFYLCSGQASLQASGADVYTWNPGNISGSLAVVSPPATTNYTLVGAIGNCTSSALSTVSLGTAPPLNIFSSGDSGCRGSCFTYSNSSNQFNPYTYIWGDGSTSTAMLSSHCYSVSGNYTVQAQAIYSTGCSVISANTLSITILPTPFAAITLNNTGPIYMNQPALISNISQGAQIFKWSFDPYPTSEQQSPLNISLTYSAVGNYCVRLLATDTVYKCSDSTKLCVDITCFSEITLPNIFTPNDDDANDVFKFKTNCIRSLNCNIYNRWGAILYSWTGVNGGWDGRTSAGLKASEGTYFYVVEYVDENNNIVTKRGTLLLIN